jgi:hypothetical protein
MAFGERTHLDGGMRMSDQERIRREAILRWAGPDAILPEPKPAQQNYQREQEQDTPQNFAPQQPGGIQFIQYFGAPQNGAPYYPVDQPKLDTGYAQGNNFNQQPQKPIVESQSDPVNDIVSQLQSMGLVVEDIQDEEPDVVAGGDLLQKGAQDSTFKPVINYPKQLLEKYLPTRRRQIAAVGALALILSPLYNNRAHDFAAELPIVGSQFATVEAIDAFDGSILTPEQSEQLNNFLETALSFDKVRLLATSNIGTTETNPDGTVQNAFNQPVELTTEVGVLTGDAVSLKIVNAPELSWQIKITEPKFTLSSGGQDKSAYLSLDPSSIVIFPQIEAIKTEWNTISPDLIATKLREINPNLTEEQIATAKAGADTDLAASQAAVSNAAMVNAVEHLLASPEVVDALNKATPAYLRDLLVTSDGYEDLDMADYQLKLCSSDDETVCSPKIEVSTEKILEDYKAHLASNETPEASPNVKLTQTVNGLNIVQPQKN